MCKSQELLSKPDNQPFNDAQQKNCGSHQSKTTCQGISISTIHDDPLTAVDKPVINDYSSSQKKRSSQSNQHSTAKQTPQHTNPRHTCHEHEEILKAKQPNPLRIFQNISGTIKPQWKPTEGSSQLTNSPRKTI